MKLKTTMLWVLALFAGTSIYSQTELVIEPENGFLNAQILADNQAHDIYVLRRGATYLVKDPFENQGWKLHIKAEDGNGALPIIAPYPNSKNKIKGAIITLFGDLELENICMKGDYPGIPWAQRFVQNEYENAKIDVNGCIFMNTRGSAFQIAKPADYAKIDNCLFVNMGNIAMGNQGNGRVFDCRDSDINLLRLTNSTFVNTIDRILRHRGGGTMKEVVIDHCTSVHNGGYHGFIELGGIESFTMTNNLIVDNMGFGADQFDDERLIELDAHTEQIGGKAKMVWIGSVPDAVDAPVPSTFAINNNIYKVSTELQAYYDLVQGDKAVITEGPILTDYIAGKISNAATAFVKKDISLANIPASMTNIYAYHSDPAGLNYAKTTTDAVTYDGKDHTYWTQTLDCKYTTDDADFMGSDAVPVGDPRWGSVVEVEASVAKFNSDVTQLVCYPNPFTEQLNVEFTLKQYSEVTIDIHDIAGKLVSKIEAGNLAPGTNAVVVQRDNLEKGVYLLKLTAGGTTSFAKIIVN